MLRVEQEPARLVLGYCLTTTGSQPGYATPATVCNTQVSLYRPVGLSSPFTKHQLAEIWFVDEPEGSCVRRLVLNVMIVRGSRTLQNRFWWMDNQLATGNP